MAPTGCIVCGVDHSSGARVAARFAASLADRLGLRLILVYAVAPPIPQSELGMAARRTDWEVIDELQRAGAELLEEIAQGLEAQEIVGELKFGEASFVLGDAAEQAGAELLVVGSRGLGAVGSLVLGSVSRRLAVHAPCPTVIVPEPAAPVAHGPILCAADDSDESRLALTTAASLADRLDAQLVVVHAERDDARVSHGEELLARLAVENGLGTSVERMVVRGEPAEALVEAAASRAAELVVTGSRGRGALAAATLGSVSSALATRAPCPVAVVRAVPAPAGG